MQSQPKVSIQCSRRVEYQLKLSRKLFPDLKPDETAAVNVYYVEHHVDWDASKYTESAKKAAGKAAPASSAAAPARQKESKAGSASAAAAPAGAAAAGQHDVPNQQVIEADIVVSHGPFSGKISLNSSHSHVRLVPGRLPNTLKHLEKADPRWQLVVQEQEPAVTPAASSTVRLHFKPVKEEPPAVTQVKASNTVRKEKKQMAIYLPASLFPQAFECAHFPCPILVMFTDKSPPAGSSTEWVEGRILAKGEPQLSVRQRYTLKLPFTPHTQQYVGRSLSRIEVQTMKGQHKMILRLAPAKPQLGSVGPPTAATAAEAGAATVNPVLAAARAAVAAARAAAAAAAQRASNGSKRRKLSVPRRVSALDPLIPVKSDFDTDAFDFCAQAGSGLQHLSTPAAAAAAAGAGRQRISMQGGLMQVGQQQMGSPQQLSAEFNAGSCQPEQQMSLATPLVKLEFQSAVCSSLAAKQAAGPKQATSAAAGAAAAAAGGGLITSSTSPGASFWAGLDILEILSDSDDDMVTHAAVSGQPAKQRRAAAPDNAAAAAAAGAGALVGSVSGVLPDNNDNLAGAAVKQQAKQRLRATARGHTPAAAAAAGAGEADALNGGVLGVLPGRDYGIMTGAAARGQQALYRLRAAARGRHVRTAAMAAAAGALDGVIPGMMPDIQTTIDETAAKQKAKRKRLAAHASTAVAAATAGAAAGDKIVIELLSDSEDDAFPVNRRKGRGQGAAAYNSAAAAAAGAAAGGGELDLLPDSFGLQTPIQQHAKRRKTAPPVQHDAAAPTAAAAAGGAAAGADADLLGRLVGSQHKDPVVKTMQRRKRETAAVRSPLLAAADTATAGDTAAAAGAAAAAGTNGNQQHGAAAGGATTSIAEARRMALLLQRQATQQFHAANGFDTADTAAAAATPAGPAAAAAAADSGSGDLTLDNSDSDGMCDSGHQTAMQATTTTAAAGAAAATAAAAAAEQQNPQRQQNQARHSPPAARGVSPTAVAAAALAKRAKAPLQRKAAPPLPGPALANTAGLAPMMQPAAAAADAPMGLDLPNATTPQEVTQNLQQLLNQLEAISGVSPHQVNVYMSQLQQRLEPFSGQQQRQAFSGDSGYAWLWLLTDYEYLQRAVARGNVAGIIEALQGLLKEH